MQPPSDEITPPVQEPAAPLQPPHDAAVENPSTPEVFMPPVRRSRSGGLVVTFLLGVGVGAAVCYGLLTATGGAAPAEDLATLAEQPAIPLSEAPADELADINGYWPARHIVLVLDELKPSPETMEVIGAFKPGAVMLSPTLSPDAAAMRELSSALKRAVGRTGLPLIVAADAGNLNPLADGPPPAYFSLGAVGDPAAATEAGAAYAVAARARGLDAVMAPWTNVAAQGQPRPALSWTADPTQSANLVLAYLDGVQSEGVLSIALSFPVSGLAVSFNAAQSRVDEQELRLIAEHMVPLREAAAGGVDGILVSHTSVPVLDKRFPDRPATLSPTLVTGILRSKWKYEGVAIAEDLSPLAEALKRPVEELFVESLAAGCDAVVLSRVDRTTMRRICAQLLALVNAQGLDPAALDVSKTRLNQWQERIAAMQQRARHPVPSPQPPETELLRHSVQPNETLIGIARQYNVRVSDVKEWNGLADSKVQAGQKLNIYLSRPGGEEAPPPEAGAGPAAALPVVGAPADGPTHSTAPEESGDAPAEAALDESPAPPAPMEEKKSAPASEKRSRVETPLPGKETAPEEEKKSESKRGAEKEVESENPAPRKPMDGKYHVWSEGDTPEDVAAAYGISVEQLREWNYLDTAPPANGMELIVVESAASGKRSKETPAAPEVRTKKHTVKAGDTLSRIAAQYNTTKKELVRLNNLEREDLVWVGQQLKVPAE